MVRVTAAGEAQVPSSRRRARRAAVAFAVLIGAGAGGLWLARVPIARGVIDRELAKAGVPARYAITDLGFGRQRLTDVVIGDPRAPDLVADWIETYTDVGTGGARLSGVRVGQVRLRARLVDGRVSLGALDRLLPAPSGRPFALPALDAVIRDARVRLETPYGVVGLALAGAGRLDDGFRGRLAAVAPRLALGDCTVRGLAGAVRVSVRRTAPTLAGPMQAEAVACAGGRGEGVAGDVRATLGPALDRWRGEARVSVATLDADAARLERVRGRVGFSGDAARTQGPVSLTAARFAGGGVRGQALGIAGTWRVGGGRAVLAGRVRARDVALPRAMRRALAELGGTAAGTPVAPLLASAGRGLAQAAGALAVEADVAVGTGARTLATVERVSLSAANGLRATLHGGGGVVIGHPAGVRVDGELALSGGGLPQVTARLAQARPGAPITGTATVARWAEGGAALALTPVSFSAAPDGATRVTTQATLSGPVADGRVEAVTLPLDARWDGRGTLTVNPACAPLSFARVAVSGLTLRPARATLCPVDGALVRVAQGRVGGGASVGAVRLDGAIGGTPLSLAAREGQVRLGSGAFALAGVTARLGSPERVTRLDFAALAGGFGAGGVAGTFAGGEGQIANVPLLLGGAAGDWRVRGGDLTLSGAMTVADADAQPRFQPLDARAVTLRLVDGAIDARGTLFEPTRGMKVADVTIDHRLSSGAGAAHLAVPGITFAEGFQPELLTRLTFGVIADVRGTVKGEGDIAWSGDGVTSTGTFSTDDTDLAAAFGPVEGIAGTIRFTDLLALESAPAQVATVASINPGVPVTDGRITYQTLRGTRVQVDGGTWPFAGGTLTLEPTLLDFSSPAARRMTLRVDAMDAGKFLQQFDFENLNATGTFDGSLPMLFDASGGRIEGGRLVARAPGGTLAYVGQISKEKLGFWGDFAFQALKSLTYRELSVTMDGPLAGEMVTGVRFAGVQQGKGAKSNFIVRRLTRLPIRFDVTIRAPFRGLIDSAASFYDPERLVARNLQPLLEEQNRRAPKAGAHPIQPSASETVP